MGEIYLTNYFSEEKFCLKVLLRLPHQSSLISNRNLPPWWTREWGQFAVVFVSRGNSISPSFGLRGGKGNPKKKTASLRDLLRQRDWSGRRRDQGDGGQAGVDGILIWFLQIIPNQNIVRLWIHPPMVADSHSSSEAWPLISAWFESEYSQSSFGESCL